MSDTQHHLFSSESLPTQSYIPPSAFPSLRQTSSPLAPPSQSSFPFPNQPSPSLSQQNSFPTAQFSSSPSYTSYTPYQDNSRQQPYNPDSAYTPYSSQIQARTSHLPYPSQSSAPSRTAASMPARSVNAPVASGRPPTEPKQDRARYQGLMDEFADTDDDELPDPAALLRTEPLADSTNSIRPSKPTTASSNPKAGKGVAGKGKASASAAAVKPVKATGAQAVKRKGQPSEDGPAPKKARGGRKVGAKTFREAELKQLHVEMRLLEKHVPIGGAAWIALTAAMAIWARENGFPVRSVDSWRRKWFNMATKKKPTGEGEMADIIREAKEIYEEMEAINQSGELGDDDTDFLDEDGAGEEEEEEGDDEDAEGDEEDEEDEEGVDDEVKIVGETSVGQSSKAKVKVEMDDKKLVSVKQQRHVPQAPEQPRRTDKRVAASASLLENMGRTFDPDLRAKRDEERSTSRGIQALHMLEIQSLRRQLDSKDNELRALRGQLRDVDKELAAANQELLLLRMVVGAGNAGQANVGNPLANLLGGLLSRNTNPSAAPRPGNGPASS